MAQTRVRVPKSAKKGELIEVKTIVKHTMESGRRKGADGKLIPQQIVNKFECMYGGKTVFSADFAGSVSANPNLSFFLRAADSGKIDFKWTEDNGTVSTDSAEITVS